LTNVVSKNAHLKNSVRKMIKNILVNLTAFLFFYSEPSEKFQQLSATT
jgi:hypothetical protein